MFEIFLPSLVKGLIGKRELRNMVSQKLYKSIFMLYTSPFKRGETVSVDKYTGVVNSMGIWYVNIKSKKSNIFIPTSFLYDKVIEKR